MIEIIESSPNGPLTRCLVRPESIQAITFSDEATYVHLDYGVELELTIEEGEALVVTLRDTGLGYRTVAIESTEDTTEAVEGPSNDR